MVGPRGSPKIALTSAQSDLPPLPRRTFQLPGGASSTRGGRVIFPGFASPSRACRELSGRHRLLPPDAPRASESCRVSAPREPGWRSTRQRPGIEAEGETTGGPNGGLTLAEFHMWGSNRNNTNHQRGGSRWLIAQNSVNCKRLTLQEGNSISLHSFVILKGGPSRSSAGRRGKVISGSRAKLVHMVSAG